MNQPQCQTADDIIQRLALSPHPEGGWFRETWRAEASIGQRPSGTAIYYLLKAGERSQWHRVDAVEIWHYYAGAPLELSLSNNGKTIRNQKLGADISNNETPQVIVPKDCWQSAESLGAWTLVGCTVSPGFQFEGFEMAPEDWSPSA
ncbi:cupin domain-containing protein [Hyphococcus flavus]|uniref:Cupin domain-containing protein n=1 Tax=Hyphococcus flavus TaxID=1866326 RepID=A0AAF0CGN4_9PROT|nr:cupin domain-containing protein [Hyphococcus flavus]WDI32639.1 cupin domain-containing protein [Hyphococcus flavus]